MATKKKQKRGFLKKILENTNLFSNEKISKYTWKKIGIVGAIFISVVLVMSINYFPETFEQGEISLKTIFAHRDVEDKYSTEKMRDEMETEVQDVYEHHEEIDEEILEKINAVFYELKKTLDNLKELENEEAYVENYEEKKKEEINALEDTFEAEFGFNLEDNIIRNNVTNIALDTLNEMRFEFRDIVSIALETGIKGDELNERSEEIKEEVSALDYGQSEELFMIWLVEELLEPNVIYNEVATEEKIEEARQDVEPEMILEGEVIVREGERITERHALILEELGLKSADRDFFMFLGLVMIVGVIFLLLGLFIYYFKRDLFNDDKRLVLAGLIFVTTLLIAQGVSLFSIYLIPLAMAAILYAVLFDAKISVMFVGMLSILVGILTEFSVSAMVVAITGGLVGTFSVTRLQERGDLTKAGIYVALVNVVTIISLVLITGDISLEEQVMNSVYGVTNGFFSGILAIGLLPYLESGFGLTTPVRLLELSNPNHPMLKKLMMEAPGTYHHSIIVGNLAEAAAEKVEADPILARVGAYYHDIGKINRPYFFIENQFTKENPHNKISPSLSSLIIVSHVKEGVELARDYKLPEIIQDIIREHHGTNFVGYFFRQIQEDENNKSSLLEEDFRYKGPKPQSKEGAIVMLADSVEAAVRSMSNPTSHKIENLVHRIVKKHLEENQLSECHLTFKELSDISKSFIQLLLGIYHSRIKYPEELMKRSKMNGAYDKGTTKKKTDKGRKRDDGKDSQRGYKGRENNSGS